MDDMLKSLIPEPITEEWLKGYSEEVRLLERAEVLDELRRAMWLIKITAYNGEELIRRGSVLDVIDQRRLNL